MGGALITRIRNELDARRRAMLEAEALVERFASKGVYMAKTLAKDGSVPAPRRDNFRRVATIAERRHDMITGLDDASRHKEIGRWRGRPDALIR